MNFEKFFTKWLTEKLNTTADSKFKVISANDIAFKIDEELQKPKNDGSIFMLVQAGNAVKSNIPWYDLNTLPTNITIVAWQELKDDVITALQTVSEENNAILNNATLNGENVKFRAVFNTPLVTVSQDMRRGNGLGKIVTIQWVVNVNYGLNAYVIPHVFKLKVGEVEYNINYVAHYERASSPSYEEHLPEGSELIGRTHTANVNTYNFVIYSVVSDELQSVFNQELNGDDNVLSNSVLYLTIDNNDPISVVFDSVSETYENNTSAFNLAVKR